ncbi:MAG: prepilin-type N-terminal cleavage/methylation domain-containing protein [Verrucomicrobiota bacterium]
MNRRRYCAAFTLIEVLIAVTITMLIVVLLGTMFSSLTSTTSRANQRTDAFRDARAALQMMERDLTGLVRAQKTAYLALDNLRQDGSDPYSVRTNGTPNLQLFALVAAKNQPPGNPAPPAGDVCAVGYYCRWDNEKHSYSLLRFFRNSKQTYDAIKPQLSGSTLSYTDAPTLYAAGATGILDDVLASYVWNLKITVFKSDGTQDTTYPGNPVIVGDPGNPNVVLPAAIEISFNAISPEAARTIMALSAGPSDWMDSTSQNYVRLIKPHAYEFRTRISL